jgi:hypothetical protein
MDPFSISVGVVSCTDILAKVSKWLIVFSRNTKQIDSSVTNLERQVTGLSKNLNLLDAALKQPALLKSPAATEETWKVLNQGVEECKTTVVHLDTKLEGLKAPEGNWARQAWRQLKLDLRQDEIDAMLSAMRTHSANLQLAMVTVNV